MRFNQVIWDALCLACVCGQDEPKFLDALDAYAADCAGQCVVNEYPYEIVFVPNPNSQY